MVTIYNFIIRPGKYRELQGLEGVLLNPDWLYYNITRAFVNSTFAKKIAAMTAMNSNFTILAASSNYWT